MLQELQPEDTVLGPECNKEEKKNDTILGNPNKTPSALIQFTLLIHLTVILLTYFDCAAPIVGQYVGTL